MKPAAGRLVITHKARKRGEQATKRMQKVRVAALRKHSVSGNSLKAIEAQNADRPLTEMQLKFVRLWASGETPRTAAAMAGYSESSANISWKLSRDPAILKLYRAEKLLYEQAEGHTKKRVMSMLQEAYDCAKLVSEPASMVAAARELGKMAGHYEPEVRINVNIGEKLADRMNSLSDAELLEIMEKEDALPGVFKRIVDVPSTEAKLLENANAPA